MKQIKTYMNDLLNLHSEITKKVIGCAMKVHSVRGNGFQEIIYQRALAIEMKYENISFVQEFECRFITGMN